MSEKATAGPWRVTDYSHDYYHDGYGITAQVQPEPDKGAPGGEYHVAFYGIQEKADALLMAAAPEMLAVLKESEEMAQSVVRLAEANPDQFAESDQVAWARRLLAAIAKAEGAA